VLIPNVRSKLDDSYRIQVCDFGMTACDKICTAFQAKGVGSLRYNPPEAFDKNFGKWTKPCDMYSLGITLWEIATQQLPFEHVNLNSSDIEKLITSGKSVNTEEIEDETFRTIVQGCIKVNPQERTTIEQLLEQMTEYCLNTLELSQHHPIDIAAVLLREHLPQHEQQQQQQATKHP